jgi:hypothetical protein
MSGLLEEHGSATAVPWTATRIVRGGPLKTSLRRYRIASLVGLPGLSGSITRPESAVATRADEEKIRFGFTCDTSP